MTKHSHGGARQGAGRPRIFAESTEGRTIHLPQNAWWIIDNFRAREDIQGSSEAFRLALLDDNIREKLLTVLRLPRKRV